MNYNILVGKLHNAIDEVMENKFIEVDQGKIVKIGDIGDENKELKSYDYTDNQATPGLVDAHSHIGIYYEGYFGELKDSNEKLEALTPELNVIDAFWPFDTAIDDVVAGGVTTVCVLPGSSNLIGGVGGVLKLKSSDIVDNMVLKIDAAMKMALGLNPKLNHGKEKRGPMTRMASAALIRQAFIEAAHYVKKRKKANAPPLNLGKEHLSRVLQKEMPVFAHCARTDDIVTMLRLQEEFEYNLVLHHAYEAHISKEIIKEIRRRNIPVVLGPNFRTRGSSESQLFSFKATKILMDAGIANVSQMSDHPIIPAQYLIIQASLCVREGLDNLRALQSVTINPARILGVDERVGSLEIGKDADIVIWDNHPLDSRSKPLLTISDGRIIYRQVK